MYRVYVGNLDSEVTDEALFNLLQHKGVTVTAMVLKRGYAFIDCPDSSTFQTAIDQLNGSTLLGSVLQVEASAISKRLRTNIIEVFNLPQHTTNDQLMALVSNYGPIQRCDLGEKTSEEDGCTAVVEFDSWVSACQAFDQLNNSQFDGNVIRVQMLTESDVTNEDVESPIQESSLNYGVLHNIPLRILVPSDFIGAIIGRKGQTIRHITAETKTRIGSDISTQHRFKKNLGLRPRIDIHGKETAGMLEKLISISGLLENCSAACREIMTVLQRETTSADRGDVTLRLLIDDRYCGRIIGRDGRTVKKIREETGTRISISNVQEMASIYPDRVVAIRGTLDNMSRAENAISAKLRECYEKDMVSLHRPANARTSLMTTCGAVHCNSPTLETVSYSAGLECNAAGDSALAVCQKSQGASHVTMREICHIGIPNYAVGAIIGSAGANIKRIIRDSNAYVTVEPRRENQNPSDDRYVTIKGSSDACWRASYFIFEKMKLEGFAGADGDVRLRTLISIPQSSAGRVVGRSGKNVREIQRSTGAVITLPSADTTHSSEQTEANTDIVPQPPSGEVTVEVYGNFIATQSAHSRIRSIIHRAPSSSALA